MKFQQKDSRAKKKKKKLKNLQNPNNNNKTFKLTWDTTEHQMIVDLPHQTWVSVRTKVKYQRSKLLNFIYKICQVMRLNPTAIQFQQLLQLPEILSTTCPAGLHHLIQPSLYHRLNRRSTTLIKSCRVCSRNWGLTKILQTNRRSFNNP